MSKRFTEDFKRSKSYLANMLFSRCLDKTYRGRSLSIFVVHNWIYNRTPNELLEVEFENLLNEVEPESLVDAFQKAETEAV